MQIKLKENSALKRLNKEIVKAKKIKNNINRVKQFKVTNEDTSAENYASSYVQKDINYLAKISKNKINKIGKNSLSQTGKNIIKCKENIIDNKIIKQKNGHQIENIVKKEIPNNMKVFKQSIKKSNIGIKRIAYIIKKMTKITVGGTKTIIFGMIAGGWIAVVIIIFMAFIGGFITAIFNSSDANYDTSQIPNSEIILVAKAQIGNEGGDKFWKWYGFETHVAWCCCFISWCANECNYIDKDIIPKFSVCSDGIDWFTNRNQWHDRGASYYPIVGDIIFFDWKDENGNQDGTSDHVGIVTRTDVTNRNIYTIEGNTSNKCAERMYSLDDVQVMGYGSPKY